LSDTFIIDEYTACEELLDEKHAFTLAKKDDIKTN